MSDKANEVEAKLRMAIEGNPPGGRKLTFRAKCGAFASLYGGQSNRVVARAFGVSPQTVSKLSGCLENDPDPYRYEPEDARSDGSRPDLMKDEKVFMDHNRNRLRSRQRFYDEVAREFEALGKAEFNARYYTDRVHARIMQAKDDIAAEKGK